MAKMIRNICAAFGKPRVGGFEERLGLDILPFENSIYCKHCVVHKSEGIYSVSCNKSYMAVNEEEMADSLEKPDVLNRKIEQLASLLEGLRVDGERIFLLNRQVHLDIPMGVSLKNHYPCYLKYFLPAIGESTAAIECWDFEPRKNKEKFIEEDGIVKILSVCSKGNDKLFEINRDAESIDKMYKVLKGDF